MTKNIVVVGAGMVSVKFVNDYINKASAGFWRITVIGEEQYQPYDRVQLTSYFDHLDANKLFLNTPEPWQHPNVKLVTGCKVTTVDHDKKEGHGENGQVFPYDELVFATGSYAPRPPIPNNDIPGTFVYRTIDDVESIRNYVLNIEKELGRPAHGVVVGGGLLGLEAAGALSKLGAKSTIIQATTHLLSTQIDFAGGQTLTQNIKKLGLEVRTEALSTSIEANDAGAVSGIYLSLGPEKTETELLEADVVIFSVGIRARDELGAQMGLELGPRGGVVVDKGCRTQLDNVWAIGEVACMDGFCLGLIAPGNTMAEITVANMLGGDLEFPEADLSTKLKLSGVDVASFGDALGETPACLEVTYCDPLAGIYKKLVLDDAGQTLLGGILIGDAADYSILRSLTGRKLSGDPAKYLLPAGISSDDDGPGDLPEDLVVCSCNNVSVKEIKDAICDGCTDLASLKSCTKAGTTCGSCLPLVKNILNQQLTEQGVEVSNALCEHFEFSRAQLFEAIKVSGLNTFTGIIERFGNGGRGCDLCKPTVGSILASLGNGHVLQGEQSALQDTNDHALANLQKDGTYSVVPRIAGGEVTPDGLIKIGEVAKEFGLYTKITGGQRIDMFGARLEELPAIWSKLVAAGFESGQAYGKSLRNVKSCVGSTWCRYGVQDSVGMAILLELRFRGLRSPHKLKFGVSGCARECAEARGKDVGVIATEKGWNLYVGGNGGFIPAHAKLIAEDLDDDALIRAVDRYIMYYIRSADRLQRTARWMEELEGGIDFLREVIFEDSLGICADLDAAMARHVDTYQDEWRQTLADPEKLKKFVSFINAPYEHDPNIVQVAERDQIRPATASEKALVFIGGPTIEVKK